MDPEMLRICLFQELVKNDVSCKSLSRMAIFRFIYLGQATYIDGSYTLSHA